MPANVVEHEIYEDEDAWSRVTQLADTVQANELSQLEFAELLHRLFHEEDVRVFEKAPVSFRCTCTRDRVRDMLRMLGYDEVKSVLEAEKSVDVRCQFCNHYYGFDKVDVEAVFASLIPAETPTTRQ